MSGGRRPSTRGDAYTLVRERCEALRAPVWRTNAAGVVIDEPKIEGLAGLFFRGGGVARMIARAAADWDGRLDAAPIEVFEGAWLIGVPETYRRRLSGYSAVLALTPAALEDDRFRELCADSQVDCAAARRALRPFAEFDEASMRRLATSLEWMVSDLTQLVEHDETIEGFTDQLGNAYETIDLLYSLGHAMSRLQEPDGFVATALEQLHDTMEFAWVGVLFEANEDTDARLSDRFYFAGSPTMDGEALESAARALVAELEHPCERRILGGLDGFEPDGGPQVVLQPVIRGGRATAYLLAGEKTGLDPQVSSYDTHLIEAASGYLAPFMENTALYAQQQRMYLGTLEALTAAIDAKDRYTCGHSERVSHLSAAIAEAVGLDRDFVETTRIAGLVHDVGKIGVPESILCKNGRLTDPEFDAIKLHPEIGYRILKDIPRLREMLPGVLHHHERWDGRGYPHGISGEQIPLLGRIIAIADTFDAMSSTRAYRPAMPREKVLAEIERCAGSQFDPALVPAFLSLELEQYDAMVAEAAAQTPIIAPSEAA
ncbi:MAG: HD-GYP domain-containing protein [Phycisphaerales bacterium JB037]